MPGGKEDSPKGFFGSMTNNSYLHRIYGDEWKKYIWKNKTAGVLTSGPVTVISHEHPRQKEKDRKKEHNKANISFSNITDAPRGSDIKYWQPEMSNSWNS